MTYQRESTNHSFMMKKLSMDLVNLHVLESAKKSIIRLLQKKTNSMRFIGSHLNNLLQFEEGMYSTIQDLKAERPTQYLQNLGDYLMIGIQVSYKCVDIRKFCLILTYCIQQQKME